jgi:hypothetical protein
MNRLSPMDIIQGIQPPDYVTSQPCGVFSAAHEEERPAVLKVNGKGAAVR